MGRRGERWMWIIWLREIRALGERVGVGFSLGDENWRGVINSGRDQKSQRAKPNKYDLETRAIIAVGSGEGIDGSKGWLTRGSSLFPAIAYCQLEVSRVPFSLSPSWAWLLFFLFIVGNFNYLINLVRWGGCKLLSIIMLHLLQCESFRLTWPI